MNDPNWRNRTLFHGDNLRFLRTMNSDSVHLIATDPPFNKGRDFHATPDSLAAGARFQDRWSWEADVHQEWIDQISDDHPPAHGAIESARYAHSDGMGAFMCFMAVRLLAMRRVLRDDGSIYLHCDPTASHYLKAVMDAVFGWKNFKNEIVWSYGLGGSSRRMYSKKHDILLFYTVGKQWYFDKPMVPATSVRMKGEMKGVDDVWSIPSINNMAKERVGYPTQKPLTLYERIIKASSNEGDVVLDPFAGCATTCVAAERLGRQWVGIDIWDSAYETVVHRLENEVGLFGDVHYVTEPPERTDDGETSAPFLRVKEAVREPDGPRMSRAEMFDVLLSHQGIKCQGCDRKFDDPRYLELDHNTPRADGGINHVSNRILLCSPCNRTKAHRFTLSGLREENRKRGYMAPS